MKQGPAMNSTENLEEQATAAVAEQQPDLEERAAPRDTKREAKPSPPKADKLPPYKVLLHNDDHNDMGYVAETILQLTPLKQFEAIRKMYEAHQRGLTLLLTTHQERAELYRDQFKAKGLTVTVEPA